MTNTFQSCQPSAMTRAEFVGAFGAVYEHSAWVAVRAYDAGITAIHDGPTELHRVMADVLLSASIDEQLAVIRAHPSLGDRVAVALTASSLAEQAGAGLQDCSPQEFARFQELNAAYVAKFGFPFIMAVKGSGRLAILKAFETRIHHDRDVETHAALLEINKIALFRLAEL